MTPPHPSPRVHRPIVTIIGGASASPPQLALAERLGAAFIDAGFRVLTGGRGGVMAAASRGARHAQGWQDGRVLGVLPGESRVEANPWVDIALPTGLGHARNALVARMGDGVLAVGGGAGTLSELALAWQFGKPVAAVRLPGAPGWSGRVAGAPLDQRRADSVTPISSVADALAWAEQLPAVQAWRADR